MNTATPYLMENAEEIRRLEIKTDPAVVREQAAWCDVRAGYRILDAGCGPGKTSAILFEMSQPGGRVVGVDYSEERIEHAKARYERADGITFYVHDLRNALENLGTFDLVWVRFVLEYNRSECVDIVNNLSACLKPGGYLCLLDLDHNCLSHYEMPPQMEKLLFRIMSLVEEKYNFDPYAGRKLYALLYDAGYEDISVELRAHHLFYGPLMDKDVFNWFKKAEKAALISGDFFHDYTGGRSAFFKDFEGFFLDPRRFTYTPLILCKGRKR